MLFLRPLIRVGFIASSRNRIPVTRGISRVTPQPNAQHFLVRTSHFNANSKNEDGNPDDIGTSVPEVTLEDLETAAKGGDLRTVQRWKQQNPTRNDAWAEHKDGETLLRDACNNGHLDLVKYLLDDFIPNVEDDGNKMCKALWYACEGGQLDIAKYLIESRGVDVNAQDEWGESALHIACRTKSVRIVKFLVESHGADIRIEDQRGYLPIHIAYQWKSEDVMKYFMESHGMDVNVQNKNGDTLLHLAFKDPDGACTEEVKRLIESCDLDLGITNNDDKDAFECLRDDLCTYELTVRDWPSYYEEMREFATIFYDELFRQREKDRKQQK
mmetsp:Transcript_21924/g.61042  ORF Transcript_21924/g.61042 Transcript_21924/m.61042 type:complete len:328 (-) Transcript_21924:966-1949(-)